MTPSITSKKMRKIQQDTCKLLAPTSVSVREIAQFVAKATATIQALLLAPLHYRVLQSLMNAVHPVGYTQKGMNGKSNTKVQLNPLSKADLLWWQSLDRKLLSNSIAPTVPSVAIESDASIRAGLQYSMARLKQEVSGQQRRRATTSTTWSSWQHF